TNIEKVLRVWDTYYTFPPYFTKELRDIVTGIKDLEKERQEKDRQMKEQKEKEEKLRRQKQQEMKQKNIQLLASKIAADVAPEMRAGANLEHMMNDSRFANANEKHLSGNDAFESAVPDIAPVFQRLAEQQKQKQMQQQMIQPNININITTTISSSSSSSSTAAVNATAMPTPIMTAPLSSSTSSTLTLPATSSSSNTISSPVFSSIVSHHPHQMISQQSTFGSLRPGVGGPMINGVPPSMSTFQASANPVYGVPSIATQNTRFQPPMLSQMYAPRPPAMHGQVTYAPHPPITGYILTGVTPMQLPPAQHQQPSPYSHIIPPSRGMPKQNKTKQKASKQIKLTSFFYFLFFMC
ncbi:RhoGAP domain-containing protein, partial [Reticulomyxa filosa]